MLAMFWVLNHRSAAIESTECLLRMTFNKSDPPLENI
jgi:hypothetical protein